MIKLVFIIIFIILKINLSYQLDLENNKLDIKIVKNNLKADYKPSIHQLNNNFNILDLVKVDYLKQFSTTFSQQLSINDNSKNDYYQDLEISNFQNGYFQFQICGNSVEKNKEFFEEQYKLPRNLILLAHNYFNKHTENYCSSVTLDKQNSNKFNIQKTLNIIINVFLKSVDPTIIKPGTTFFDIFQNGLQNLENEFQININNDHQKQLQIVQIVLKFKDNQLKNIEKLETSTQFDIQLSIQDKQSSKNWKFFIKKDQKEFQRQEEDIVYNQFEGKKKLFGTGLHQQVQYDLQGRISESYINHQDTCLLILQDRVDENSYIDVEEFNPIFINEKLTLPQTLDENYIFVSNGHIDIEKPSTFSSQHMYSVIKKIEIQSQRSYSQGGYTVNTTFNYPIHFRYQDAQKDKQFEKISINSNPLVYLSCYNMHDSQIKTENQIQNDNNYDSLYSQLISQTLNNRKLNRLNVNYNKNTTNQDLITQIPVGNIEHKFLTCVITISLTVSLSIYLMFQISKKAKQI